MISSSWPALCWPKYSSTEITDQIQADGEETVRRWNLVLEAAASDDILPGVDGNTKSALASGWRPAGFNAVTSNAAKASTHVTAKACDIRDNQERTLARWCLLNEEFVAEVGLWFERPMWTRSWVHGQIVAPKSGLRFYVPSSSAPTAKALPEEVKWARG